MADADLDLAVEGALFCGFGTAGQRCTSLGTVIVDERVHDEFLARFARAVEGAAIGDPAEDVLYGPMIHERFLERFENDWLGLVRDHHALHGSSGTGRITAANPRAGFVGDDPERGLFVHPTIVDGVRADDELANTETFGPLVGVASLRPLGRGDRAGQRPRLRAERRDLHDEPPPRLPLPRAGQRRDGRASTTPRAAPRPTCRSAATASRATARASRGSGSSTSSRAGSR